MTDWLDDLASKRSDVARASTAGRVSGELRAAITEGRLLPGTRLSEEEIGTALGISRNTLREAFRLLTHERLLVHEFNRGVFVRNLSVDDVSDLYRVRRLVEPAVIRSAVDISPDRLAAIQDAVTEGEQAAAAEDWPAVGSANMHFHHALVQVAASSRLEEMMGRLLAELRLVFHVMADPKSFHQPYLRSNRKILTLLQAGDHEAAALALIDYLNLAEKQLLDVMA